MTGNTIKLNLQETVEVTTLAYISIMKDVPFGALNFIINTGGALGDENKTDSEKFAVVKEVFLRDREVFANARYPYRHLRQATRVLIQNLINAEEAELELPEETLDVFLTSM